MRALVWHAHCAGRIATLWAWTITPWALWAHFGVALSWWWTGNECVLSKLELQWFGQTFQGEIHARVGKRHRCELYVHFCVGCLYWWCYWTTTAHTITATMPILMIRLGIHDILSW